MAMGPRDGPARNGEEASYAGGYELFLGRLLAPSGFTMGRAWRGMRWRLQRGSSAQVRAWTNEDGGTGGGSALAEPVAPHENGKNPVVRKVNGADSATPSREVTCLRRGDAAARAEPVPGYENRGCGRAGSRVFSTLPGWLQRTWGGWSQTAIDRFVRGWRAPTRTQNEVAVQHGPIQCRRIVKSTLPNRSHTSSDSLL